MKKRRVLVATVILLLAVGSVSYVLVRGRGITTRPLSTRPTTTRPTTAPPTTAPPTTTLPSSSVPTAVTSTTAPGAVPTGVALGIDTPPGNDLQVVSQIGRVPAVLDGFFGWSQIDGAPDPFPRSFVDAVTSMGSTPMITWTPGRSWNSETGAGGPPVPAAISGPPPYGLAGIVAGSFDPYIERWAEAARNDGRTVYVRLMHEMNIGVFPWGAGVNGNAPIEYVEAFRHVVDVFKRVGAKNVQFVWCVATSVGSDRAPIADYFPGDDYVSWVAMDGYNRSSVDPRRFPQIFGADYAEVTSLSRRPVMVAETATVDSPTQPSMKANWIEDSFLNMVPKEFPRIKAILYFDSSLTRFSYPIDTSPEALAAIRTVFANSYYQASAPPTTLSY